MYPDPAQRSGTRAALVVVFVGGSLPRLLLPPSGSLPAVQVLPQSLLPGGGLLPVCAVSENWILVHVLGTSGKCT